MRRAAYDIGSATTKVKVAEIDRCHNKVLKVLYADNAPVFFRDDVNGSVKSFKLGTMDGCVSVLKQFAEKVASFAPAESTAVATSAFRGADNAEEMVARIESEIGIPVTVISQLQEARIGFVGAVMRSGAEPDRAIVWDVGGRSMQISTLQQDGRHMLIYQGKLASGQMRDYLIRQVKGMPPTVSTPNPLTPAEASAARVYAESYAVDQVPEALRNKLAAADSVVVGIGALKYYRDDAHEPVCTSSGLEREIGRLVGKDDQQIGGSYASTAVSDRLLVAGFMKALAIDRVKLADVDLTDGLFFEAEYWRPTSSMAQGLSFWRDLWSTRVESSASLALGPSSVPHIVLQR